MPQIAQILETYASQFFWLMIVFGLVYFTIGHGMLPKVEATMDARNRKIADDLAAAELARAEADDLGDSGEAGLAAARAAAGAAGVPAAALAGAEGAAAAASTSACTVLCFDFGDVPPLSPTQGGAQSVQGSGAPVPPPASTWPRAPGAWSGRRGLA